MQKETNIVLRNSCRICRIDLKIIGWSKMNVLDMTWSSVLSWPVVDYTMRLSQIVCRSASGKFWNFESEKFREKCYEALRNHLADYHLKRQKHCVKDSPVFVSQPHRKKPPLCLSFLSLSEECWFQRKQLKRRSLNCDTLPHMNCSSMVARKPESSCDSGRIAWYRWMWTSGNKGQNSFKYSFVKIWQIFTFPGSIIFTKNFLPWKWEAKCTKRNEEWNILSILSVVKIKQINQIDLLVCKNINQSTTKGQILTLLYARKWDSRPK